MVEWLKARLESLLDSLIFAGILAGGVAVWTAIEAFPIPVIIGISVGVFVIILVCIKLILKFVMKPKAITQTDHALAIPSRREALESVKVSWGLWHTGTRMRIEKLLELPSLKRVLILEPNLDKPFVGEVAERSNEKPNTIINHIKDTTNEALSNRVDTRWYFTARESALTIYDPTPVGDKPCSENAWIYVEYLAPSVGVDQRKHHIIRNSGKDKSRFMGYYKEYEDIWNDPGKSIQSISSILDTTPNAPKLARPELYITYHKHEFGVAGEGKYTGLSVDNGTPILSVEAEFRPTGPMRVEAVELCLVGKRISSLNCEVQESSDRLWFIPSNIFDVSGISLGKHDAEFVAFANGEWWRSHPFTIAFTEVKP